MTRYRAKRGAVVTRVRSLVIYSADQLRAEDEDCPMPTGRPRFFAGLQPGLSPAAQFARRLAENGCRVLVPALIDRRDTWSGNVWTDSPSLTRG